MLKKPVPKLGSNTPKYQLLTEIIQQDNAHTQKEMQIKLIENDIYVSQASVSLYLNKLNISRKRLKFFLTRATRQE
jgi:arginine repressor